MTSQHPLSPQHRRIDPESRAALETLLETYPGGFTALPTIEQRRAASDALAAAGREMAGGPDPAVVRRDLTVAGLGDDPDVPVRTYRPVARRGTLPGIYFIHSGGMCLGTIDGEDALATAYCLAADAVVVSGGYRKAPEHQHPAQSRDAYPGYRWMLEHADELGIDPQRVAIVGGSAGGNLALVTAMRARDDGLPAPRLVLAAYPMLDPANTSPCSHAVTEVGMWDRHVNIEAWEWFLGGAEPDKYASPLLETDWSGFPPVFLDVGTEDLFRDENLALVQTMVAQGVPVEFHLYPGAYHGSEGLAPQADLSRRVVAARHATLRRALAGGFATATARAGSLG